MKKLEVVDTFECTPEEFWQNFFDPSFLAALDAEAGFTGREELQVTDTPEVFRSKFRVTPKRDLPPHIQNMLNNAVKMLQKVVSSGANTAEMPEPMRKLIDWGRSTFKDILNRDPKSTEPAKPPTITLSYVEDAVYDKKEKILRWTITPDLFKDTSSLKGTIEVVPDGDGCKRTILGNIDLGIPGAGEMIEAFLMDEIAKSHEKAAALYRRWLAERKQAAQSE